MDCANCDTEAVARIVGTGTWLCGTYQTAYEWGQASPDAVVENLDDESDAEDS